MQFSQLKNQLFKKQQSPTKYTNIQRNSQPPELRISSKKIINFSQLDSLDTPPVLYYFDSKLDQKEIIQNLESFPFKQLRSRKVQMYGGEVTSQGLKQESLPPFLQELVDFFITNGILKRSNSVLCNKYNPGEGIEKHQDGPCYEDWVVVLSLGGNTMINFTKKTSILQKQNNIQTEYNSQHNNQQNITNKNNFLQFNKEQFSIYLEAGSILIFGKELYSEWLHGIDGRVDDVLGKEINRNLLINKCEEEVRDRGIRYSLTFRYVEPITQLLNM